MRKKSRKYKTNGKILKIPYDFQVKNNSTHHSKIGRKSCTPIFKKAEILYMYWKIYTSGNPAFSLDSMCRYTVVYPGFQEGGGAKYRKFQWDRTKFKKTFLYVCILPAEFFVLPSSK